MIRALQFWGVYWGPFWKPPCILYDSVAVTAWGTGPKSLGGGVRPRGALSHQGASGWRLLTLSGTPITYQYANNYINLSVSVLMYEVLIQYILWGLDAFYLPLEVQIPALKVGMAGPHS